jgi:hypothetical protein
LAGRSSKAPATPLREIPSWRTRTPIEEQRSFIDPSPYKIQKTTHTPLKTSFTTATAAATPSRSSAYREYSTTPLSHRHHNYSHNNSNSIIKDKIVPLASSSTPLSTRATEKTTPLVRTPYKTSNISNNDDLEKEVECKIGFEWVSSVDLTA